VSEVITWYLEMTGPGQLRPAQPPRVPVTIFQAEIPSPAFSRFLYTAVGGDWHWTDRLPWSPEQWSAWLDRDELETWVAYVRGTPAGYAELELQPGGQVELAYFGLLPDFHGQGIGGHLLTAATRRAWERATSRVWVHTCSLDAPHARANYEARGFRVYRVETSSDS
jgi:ribosomal protein S18 acetylase RimI-like enzyme